MNKSFGKFSWTPPFSRLILNGFPRTLKLRKPLLLVLITTITIIVSINCHQCWCKYKCKNKDNNCNNHRYHCHYQYHHRLPLLIRQRRLLLLLLLLLYYWYYSYQEYLSKCTLLPFPMPQLPPLLLVYCCYYCCQCYRYSCSSDTTNNPKHTELNNPPKKIFVSSKQITIYNNKPCQFSGHASLNILQNHPWINKAPKLLLYPTWSSQNSRQNHHFTSLTVILYYPIPIRGPLFRRTSKKRGQSVRSAARYRSNVATLHLRSREKGQPTHHGVMGFTVSPLEKFTFWTSQSHGGWDGEKWKIPDFGPVFF